MNATKERTNYTEVGLAVYRTCVRDRQDTDRHALSMASDIKWMSDSEGFNVEGYRTSLLTGFLQGAEEAGDEKAISTVRVLLAEKPFNPLDK